MIRLFTAIPIPADIRYTLHAMGQSLPGAKAVAEEQIHITLRFIGEVEGSIYKDIQESLRTIETPPFRVCIQGVGHFPPRGKPRVLWAGLQPTDELIRLKRKIDTRLFDCGLPPDNRKFSPHVTIARIAGTPLQRVTRFLAGNAFLQLDDFPVDGFNLYSSKLSPKGARHTMEARYPLRTSNLTF